MIHYDWFALFWKFIASIQLQILGECHFNFPLLLLSLLARSSLFYLIMFDLNSFVEYYPWTQKLLTQWNCLGYFQSHGGVHSFAPMKKVHAILLCHFDDNLWEVLLRFPAGWCASFDSPDISVSIRAVTQLLASEYLFISLTSISILRNPMDCWQKGNERFDSLQYLVWLTDLHFFSSKNL